MKSDHSDLAEKGRAAIGAGRGCCACEMFLCPGCPVGRIGGFGPAGSWKHLSVCNLAVRALTFIGGRQRGKGGVLTGTKSKKPHCRGLHNPKTWAMLFPNKIRTRLPNTDYKKPPNPK